MAVLVLATVASAQLAIGESTHINLSGNASFGFNGIYSEKDSNQVVFGGDANLSGYYYDPKFLSFHVSPYYNQSRLNSDYNSIFTAKGVGATANLFSGSRTPIEVSYERNYNAEGTFTVPGALGYTTNGRAQGFSVGGGAYFEGFPTLHGSFSLMDNSYDILGSTESGSSGGRAFALGSTYSRWGVNFNTSYANTHLKQHTPLLFDSLQTADQTTDQSTFQVGASRQLTKTALFSSSYSRTHFVTDYAGQNTDATYDTVNANLGWRPTEKLIVGASANYTSNFGAYLLNTIVPAGAGPSVSPAPSLAPLFRDSKYFTYGTRATYLLSRDFTLDAAVDHSTQDFADSHQSTTNVSGGGGYRHALWGGQFGAHYGLSFYTAPLVDQSAIGQSANVSFSRDVRGWRSTASVQYNTNVTTAILGYTQTGYGLNLSASHRMGEWFLTLSGRVGKNSINGASLADSLANSYSGSLSRKKFSVNGSYSRNSGESLPTVNGLIPSPVPGPIPGLLVFYSGSSYAAGASYQPTRRLKFTGSYVHSSYATENLQTTSDNMVTRLDSRVEYNFRQMHIMGTYTHLRQGVGSSFNDPTTVNAIYFGISRHFDIF
jgi:hypothetical protein